MSKFKTFLDLENPNKICFITEDRISDTELSIDHVIPWSYLYSDDLWNLVYVKKSENSSKSNIIPDENIIGKLEDRNNRLLKIMEINEIESKHFDDLQLSIETNLVRRSWVGFKG